ncbi:hypothetical protein VTH06DRAFT_4600 [Thermothelomyces fergusii]
MSAAPPPPPPPPPLLFPIPGRPQKGTDAASSGPTNSPSLPPLGGGAPDTGPPGTVLVSLLVYNGYPFADHWEYFVAPSPASAPACATAGGASPPSDPPRPDPQSAPAVVGTAIQAAGDVRSGFWLEVRRGYRVQGCELDRRGRSSPVGVGGVGVGAGVPRRVGLAWVSEELFRADVEADVEGSGGAGGGRARTVFEGTEDGEVLVEREPRCEFERILFRVPAPEKTLRSIDGSEDGSRGREKITQRNCQTWIVQSAEELVREGIFEQRVVDYLRATSIMKV